MPQRSTRFWALAALTAALLGAALSPTSDIPFFRCEFRDVTGIPCPGCGLTRSWIALGHGHLMDSLRFHPLGPPLAACAALAAGLLAAELALKRSLVDWGLLLRVAPYGAGLLIAVWLVRLWTHRLV